MLHQKFVTQPVGGINYLSLFDEAMAQRPFTAFDVAVAYATANGVRELTRRCSEIAGRDWDIMQKRWLVGIDYCRTEPIAVEMLAKQKNSSVRVHDGAAVVRRRNCTPSLPFHPKAFLFRSDTASAIVTGSGNLSRNGLTKGHEVGNVLVVRDPENNQERVAHEVCLGVRSWFDKLWLKASNATSVLPDYSKIFESDRNLISPAPTDDDAGETEFLETSMRRPGLSATNLRQLRTCKHLWMEAGTITKNRGPQLPGNQLMMSRMTRVFFGFPAEDLPKDSTIGQVCIRYQEIYRDDCSLRFSNNSMDVLGLPIPVVEGPESYDDEILHFERLSDESFRLSLGNPVLRQKWTRFSQAINGLHRMKSGRQWGVY
jgi:hypothetical protein